ncbi:MAG: hypothetical protein EHM65_05165 [Acidobacteriales bacterium]|nr:MAG: hypothetical protein EHM65_05165 [Terriglobales bacterium]
MLFTYVAADRYLRTGGTLAFVITQEVFQSKGAGEGFRRFRLGDSGAVLGIRAVHDFVKLRPFKDAANKTAAVVLTKGTETAYPVPYHVWEPGMRRRALGARPLGGPHGPWQTLGADEEYVARLAGANPYKARLGANANPYGVFWMEVKDAHVGGLVEVRNLPEMGKRPIRPVVARIEPECLYPALRGADIQRWRATPRIHALLVQDPARGFGHPEALMRERWPRTLEYLEGFREELLSRALYRKYHAEAARPYYSQFNVGEATFAPFKVVWRRMAADLSAAVVSEWPGALGAKMLLPLETTTFIGTSSAEEAHYLCAVMNSAPVRRLVRSFSSAGRGFGTPFVASQIRIPEFDPADALHGRLSEMSRAMHEDCAAGWESEIDRAVLAF